MMTEQRHAPIARRLTCDTTRELVATLERLRGPDGVIRRDSFQPEDLWPWLGGIAIHQWDDTRGDYVYRLFGTHLAQNLGRDLTGLTLAEWPPAVARIMRDQADLVRRTGSVVVSHYRLRVVQRDGQIVNRVHVQEKVVLPIAYTTEGPPDAAICFVDQTVGDIVALHDYMDETNGSCWCAIGQPVAARCPTVGDG